jgi:hypothetical protein
VAIEHRPRHWRFARSLRLSRRREGIVEAQISTQRSKDAKAQERRESEEGVTENEVAASIVDAAIEVHRALGGPGLLEAVYEEALAF